jgi:carboxyl-terminal processing protease
VLGEYALADGSALRIGTVEWLTPDGRRIWHEGIEPDVAVARATETLPTLPDDLRNVAPARVKTVADAQVERALQLIAQD